MACTWLLNPVLQIVYRLPGQQYLHQTAVGHSAHARPANEYVQKLFDPRETSHAISGSNALFQALTEKKIWEQSKKRKAKAIITTAGSHRRITSIRHARTKV